MDEYEDEQQGRHRARNPSKPMAPGGGCRWRCVLNFAHTFSESLCQNRNTGLYEQARIAKVF
jgi:hypothetical protein